ncbi:hypothetical protein GGI05_004982 [Coemansia sp. RSA 2603]|nr:hypothetical protein GGI05_004982 [Coemansia sp. RSA 2603]
MVLVQQWDTGLGQSDQFTLHGLWPDTCTGDQTGDSGFDNSRIYTNISSIIEESGDAELVDAMNLHWPSNKGDNNAFWSHEWNKHGTCVSTLNPRCYGPEYKKYRDVIDYFSAVLGLRKKYDLYKALSDKGIEPSDSEQYTADEFKRALRDGLGIEAAIKCKSGRLEEIWTWFVVRDAAVYVPVNQTFASDTCKNSFVYTPKD